MTRRDVCLETECEHARAECLAAREGRCDECWDVCAELMYYGEDASCVDTCEDVCGTGDCTVGWCDPTRCARRGVEFEPSAARDEALYAACPPYVAHLRACDPSDAGLDCDRFARTVRPEAVGLVDCLAATPCGGDLGACWKDVVPGTLGDETCARLAFLCGEEDVPFDGCMDLWGDALNLKEAIWRDDAVAALRTCLDEPGCDDVFACIAAWDAAAFGTSTDS
jgi:hypothetical protein